MKNEQKLYLTLGVGAIALLLQFIVQQGKYAQILITIAGILVSILMLLDMIKTLKSGRYGIDILAITAIIATLFVGEYWASFIILIMLTGGDTLEDYAAKVARSELQSLLARSPQTAHKLDNFLLVDIPIEKVQINDELIVKPGELVPVDGTVMVGKSLFDEASLTGEPEPVEKAKGDTLMSGSINGESAITMKADKRACDSQYQQIIQLVKESETQPAHFVRLADRYAIPFTLAAYFIAGVAWFISKDPKRFAEVLVVASPCPLILAAPIAMVAGMSRSSRNGIIIKTGTTIEKLAAAKTIAFDKTGTLTKGILSVSQIVPQGTITEEALILYAASAEQQSNHVLAASLLKYVGKKKLLKADQVEELMGEGVCALIDNKKVKVGKYSFVTNELSKEKVQQTALFLSIDDQYAGYVTFTDTLRKEAKETIHKLKKMGLRKEIMLTGDHEVSAQVIAAEVGINDVRANCLPQDKMNALKNIPTKERPVIMVGDGVNDAPSLAVADTGIAMGINGATAASESASVVILRDDLLHVSQAVQIAKDTMRIAKESVWIGIFICIVLMLIASTGVIPALIGAALQEVVDVVAIFSSLRARKGKQVKIKR